MREPARSTVSPEAEARLLETTARVEDPKREVATTEQPPPSREGREKQIAASISSSSPILLKKKRERLLLVSFRMPQALKEKLELVAKTHEINQTDIINEAIAINLQRYL